MGEIRRADNSLSISHTAFDAFLSAGGPEAAIELIRDMVQHAHHRDYLLTKLEALRITFQDNSATRQDKLALHQKNIEAFKIMMETAREIGDPEVVKAAMSYFPELLAKQPNIVESTILLLKQMDEQSS